MVDCAKCKYHYIKVLDKYTDKNNRNGEDYSWQNRVVVWIIILKRIMTAGPLSLRDIPKDHRCLRMC